MKKEKEKIDLMPPIILALLDGGQGIILYLNIMNENTFEICRITTTEIVLKCVINKLIEEPMDNKITFPQKKI